MRLVSYEPATATYTVPGDEIKPLKGYYLPDLFNRIAQRYELKEQPTLEQARTTGAKFSTGIANIEGTAINLSELAIFNDGLSATTTSTDDSELVVQDLYKWLKEELGFRDPITPIFRTYRSNLVVDFEKDPSDKLVFFTPILRAVEKEMSSYNPKINPKIQFQRVAFAIEGAPTETEFLIERRIGAAWDTTRYFCKAHLTTESHLRTLQLMDGLLSAY